MLQQGGIYAFIIDDLEHVILDFAPIKPVLYACDVPVKLLSIEDYAKKCGRSRMQVKTMCQKGRIPGAQKIGQRAWAIPENAPYPEDLRLTAGGKYVGVNL